MALSFIVILFRWLHFVSHYCLSGRVLAHHKRLSLRSLQEKERCWLTNPGFIISLNVLGRVAKRALQTAAEICSHSPQGVNASPAAPMH